MRLNKKALAILMGLTISASGTAFAASADSFTDVPKDHWSYEALDYLAHEGVIDGMGDSTFQGGRTMTRYEMAAIVAKAMQKGSSNLGDKAVIEKLSSEYSGELDTLKKRVDAHDQAIKDLNAKTDKFKVWGMTRAQMGDDNGLKNDGYGGDYNNRFYMDLEGSMKINDNATARFTIEKNARYRDREYLTTKKVGTRTDSAGKTYTYVYDAAVAGEDRDNVNNDANHNGSISNIWAELQLGAQHNWYTNIGRKWNGIGMQNLLLGGQVDGISTYHPIEHGQGWWLSAHYWKPSADWSQTVVTVDETTGAVKDTKYYTKRAPVVAALDFWGPLGKYVDANVAYARLVSHKLDYSDTNVGYYSGAKNWYAIDLKVKPAKDVSVTGSYVKSDADMNLCNWAGKGHADKDYAVKIEYKGTDLNKVGSYGLYAKWVNLGCLADIGHDDEWATREPTGINGVKGWYYGVKFVPWKNIEWETMYARVTENTNNNWSGAKTNDRHILRTMVDFHF